MDTEQNREIPWLLIINPTSGSGKVARRWQAIQNAFHQHGIPFTARLTTKRGEATEIVRQAIATEGYRNIIGIGGDGTGNEIVNGIFTQTAVPTLQIRYTMFACGTGNDWCRGHRIPTDLTAFCQMILREGIKQQDIGIAHFSENGIVQTKYFANAGGLAYDAFVVQSVENQSFRFIPKRYAYFLHILKCLFAYKAERVRLSFDGQVVEDYFYTINIGIMPFCGAGMKITPHAISDDGLLSLTLVRQLPKWKIILNTPKLYSGRVADLRETTLLQVQNLTIKSFGKPIFGEVDGEFLGSTPFQFSILEKALTIVAPA